MLHESGVELRALVNLVLKVLLTHKGHVDSAEELLSDGVNCETLLYLFERWESLHDNLVSGLDDFFLLVGSSEVLVEFFFMLIDDFILGFVSLMDFHELLDDVQVC